MPVPVKGAGKGYLLSADGFPSGAAVIKRAAFFKIVGRKDNILGEYEGTIGILPYTTELFFGGNFIWICFRPHTTIEHVFCGISCKERKLPQHRKRVFFRPHVPYGFKIKGLEIAGLLHLFPGTFSSNIPQVPAFPFHRRIIIAIFNLGSNPVKFPDKPTGLCISRIWMNRSYLITIGDHISRPRLPSDILPFGRTGNAAYFIFRRNKSRLIAIGYFSHGDQASNPAGLIFSQDGTGLVTAQNGTVICHIAHQPTRCTGTGH